jgi:transposase-like protein
MVVASLRAPRGKTTGGRLLVRFVRRRTASALRGCKSLRGLTFFVGAPVAPRGVAMEMPRQPVEWIPARDFVPSHCPRQDCAAHRSNASTFRFQRRGSYVRQSAPHRVPRYWCGTCRRCFSRQSFSCTYYAKRPELLPWVAAALQASSGHRQIARTIGCAHSTVTRISARLGRHAMLLLAQLLQELGTLAEPIVVDHFEAFEGTQDQPIGIGTAVGHRSWFVYALDPAVHGRGGRLSPAQRERVARRKERPRRGGYAGSITRLLDVLGPLCRESEPVPLFTDAKPEYAAALRGSRRAGHFLHLATPNPERGPKGSPRTREALERDRRMFPSDLLHGLLRHSCKHHTCETIAFARRANAMLERAFLTAIWRNLVKGRSERKPDRRTPAMLLGLAQEPWTWKRVLARRLFPGRVRVPQSWMRLYRREWVTPEIGPNVRHDLRHNF